MLRALARPLLASWFVYGGVQSYLEPEARAARVAPTVGPALEELGLEDVKTADLVKAHGIASIALASALALSRTPRTAALGLAGLAGVTTALSHPFWKEEDPAKRDEELEQFLKNLSLVGGVLLASTAGHSQRHIDRKKAKKAKAKEKAAAAKVKEKEAKAAAKAAAKAQPEPAASSKKASKKKRAA
ncbi:DoxX family membrane protein [Demequina subtropica]|uniref:DoxX family membrane protein n=1 Tax=Demequina subtropica TaxID=1638989 RepID=UPI0007864ECF|nr:DoxX family membrane protein [Demequina subtropica]